MCTEVGHVFTANENGAPSYGRPIRSLLQAVLTNHSKLFFFCLHSPLRTYLYADRVLWLNVRTVVLPQCCSRALPSPGYFGTIEKVWLTPGRNPLATAIYREETQSHLHLELMRERKTERERERSMKDTVNFWINNLSHYPSHFYPGQIKEERGGKKGKAGGSVRDFVQILLSSP